MSAMYCVFKAQEQQLPEALMNLLLISDQVQALALAH